MEKRGAELIEQDGDVKSDEPVLTPILDAVPDASAPKQGRAVAEKSGVDPVMLDILYA